MKREERIREAFSPLLDGELTVEEREAIEAELAEESELLRELDGMRQVDALYRRLPSEPAPSGFEANVRAMIDGKRLEDRRRTRMLNAAMPLLAAAAVILVVAGIAWGPFRGESERFEMASEPTAAPGIGADSVAADQAPAEREEAVVLGMQRAESPEAADDTAASSQAQQALDQTFTAESTALAPPPAAAPMAGRRVVEVHAIGVRSFERVDAVWVESGYAGEAAEDIEREDGALAALISDRDERQRLLELPGAVLFRVDSVWYRLPEATP